MGHGDMAPGMTQAARKTAWRTGVSLIEFLIVIAVIGALLGILAPNLFALRASGAVGQAVQDVAREIERARLEARRLNTLATVTMNEGDVSFTVAVGGIPGAETTRTITLPQNTVLAAVPANQLTFQPPYGALAQPGVHVIGVAWSGPRYDVQREIGVVGVMGKVVLR